MKKLILFCILLMGLSTYAQPRSDKDNYFSGSFGFDVRNGFVGSKPTNFEPALNWTGELHAVTENVDFGIGYESFERIKYNRKFVGLGYHIKVGYITNTDIKFTIQPSLEYSNITREWGFKEKRSFGTGSFNTNLNLDLNKTFAVQLGVNGLLRTDKKVLYNESASKVIWSNTLKLVIKLEK